MSTNYYARILPSKERISQLHKAIDLSTKGENWDYLYQLVEQTYCQLSQEGEGGEIHLGKRAGGWKFLWDANIREKALELHKSGTPTKSEFIYLYPLTHKGITDFVMREDVLIISGDGDVQDKQEFLNMAFSWDGLDSAAYHAAHPEEIFPDCLNDVLIRRAGYTPNCGDFYSDGLRFSTASFFR